MSSKRFTRIGWRHTESIGTRGFDCGYCGKHVGPDQGYKGYYKRQGNSFPQMIYVCSHCSRPTFFDLENDQEQFPGPAAGRPVEHLPDNVGDLYEEARRAMSVSAFTAAVMACRKILMNVAVEEGAKENQKFAYYVKWLSDNHYIPPGGEGWVKQIKDAGNEANHEIPHITRDLAMRILRFTQGLLVNVYELRHEGRTEEPDEPDEAG